MSCFSEWMHDDNLNIMVLLSLDGTFNTVFCLNKMAALCWFLLSGAGQ